jgi:membrane protease YdiL (CAAX protease family)
VLLPLALTLVLRVRTSGSEVEESSEDRPDDRHGDGEDPVVEEGISRKDVAHPKIRRGRGLTGRLADTLASLGLRRGHLTRGLGATLVLGVAIGLFQARFSRAAEPFAEAVRSGRVIWLLPLAFVLLLFLTGFTEEFFFRGFLQTRLEALTRSRWVALIVASLLFGAYHIPYAYYQPTWPSAGDWGAAVSTAMFEGTLGGLVLGGLYLWSGGNLVAVIILHALVDAFPAVGLIRFGGS